MDLVRIWTEWEIQILVLCSLSLQITLLLFAGIRRRTVSKVLRTLLWLAYMSADFIAIYALGHLSTTQYKSDQPHWRQLIVFWAPFLLLHLGGQDTITAYSLEDNRLWLRHFLTFGAQVAMAAYVLYKSIAGSGLLVPAAILLFLAGVLKYGERVWALRCADLDNLRRSITSSEIVREIGDEDVWLKSHVLLRRFGRLFLDATLGLTEQENLTLQRVVEAEDAYSVIEHELSLMYDVLYTKAGVIHRWYGYSIRLASFLSIVAALVLFSGFNKDRYSRADVAITYVLLVGASVLEINAICRVLLSSWTCAALYDIGLDRLLRVVLGLRRLITFAKTKRRWSESMGQHNLIDSCIDPNRWKVPLTVYVKVLLEKFSLELKSFMLQECAPGYVKVSPELKRLISQELKKKAERVRNGLATIADFKNCRGQWVLKHRGCQGLSELLDWGSDGNPDGSTSQRLESPYQLLHSSVNDIGFGESILVWHIATDIFLRSRETSDERHEVAIVEAVRALSNYMAFLLVEHPSMLPGAIMRSRYDGTCFLLRDLLKEADDGRKFRSHLWRQGQTAEILSKEYRLWAYEWMGHSQLLPLWRALQLARLLINSRGDMLGVVAEVWVEMLCYTANNCSGAFHAEQLSNGGELATVVWFLMAHYGLEGHIIWLADGYTVG